MKLQKKLFGSWAGAGKPALERTRRLGAVVTLGVASLALAGAADVTFQPPGAGVGGELRGLPVPEQINSDDIASQALLIDFQAPLSGISVTVSNLIRDEGGCSEVGRWTAFDEGGIKLAEGLLKGETSVGPTTATATTARALYSPDADRLTSMNAASAGTLDPYDGNVGTATLPAAADGARYLVFDALPYEPLLASTPVESCPTDDGSDYFVGAVVGTIDGEEVPTTFGSTMESEDSGAAWQTGLPAEAFIGYEFGTPFSDGNSLIDPTGARIGVIVIDDDVCDGGTGDGSATSCEVQFDDRLTSSVSDADDVQGTLQLVAVETLKDIRMACHSGDIDHAVPLYVSTDLEVSLTEPASLAFEIPEYLCGIPIDGVPQFTVVEVAADVTITRSFVDHLVDNDAIAPFDCLDPALVTSDMVRSQQPQLGWLPRPDEQQVLLAPGVPSTVLENVTSGCGSTRGRTGRWSYLVYDLRHLEGTPYVEVIGAELDQLRATFSQLSACVNRGTLRSTIRSRIDKTIKWFDKGPFRYAKAKRELLKLRRQLLRLNSRLGRDLPSCFYDPVNLTVVAGDETTVGVEPRNARGDGISQVDHILYMLETMLGVLEPPLPADF